jgi:hypothetical protein
MPNIDKHPNGSFAWIELSTSDQNAAKQFYSSLFGWTSEDNPMGPDSFYTMFQLEGRLVGATYTMGAEEKGMGVPPHWNLYVEVASADETAAKASTLGGTVLAGPFDVYTYGRMAVIQDPTGAVLCIWHSLGHTGSGVAGQPGSFCWADLNTSDTEKAGAFYTGLFGWTLERGKDDYVHIKNGDAHIGGIPPASQMQPNTPPHWMIYLQVDDCDASTAKAKKLGASIYMGPMTIEHVGRMSVIADPQGAVTSLFQPLPHR